MADSEFARCDKCGARADHVPVKGCRVFISMTDVEAKETSTPSLVNEDNMGAACTFSDAEVSLSSKSTVELVSEAVPVVESILINGSLLRPCGDQPDSKLDDSEVSELSARFIDSLDLLPTPKQATAASALESKSSVVDPATEDAEKKKFNEGMEVISRFAEDVVKTWFAQMYNCDLKELFPDGLVGHVGSIRMMPTKEMLEERRKRPSVVPKDEESRGDDSAVDTSGWELKLVVVDANHRENLMRWREEEPGVLQQMQGLLKTAWGYIQYALESYGLPNPELFVEKVIPSPWGTLYVLGAPDASPQIGVSIVRCEADTSKDVKNGYVTKR